MASAPRLFGPRADLLVFGGPVLLGAALALLAPFLAPSGALPPWAYLALVVGVDVAHVHAMAFRTYLDPEELARRPLLYAAVPAGLYVAGVLLHGHSSLLFWRVLAYVAVFHFVRQQVGWVAILRARAGERGRLGRVLDDALIYAVTGYPLLHWHSHGPRNFSWFVPGDFVALPALAALTDVVGLVYAALAVAYVARAISASRRGASNPSKHLVVAGTALTWWLGIVAFDSDLAFTATNVLAHGVPYLALLWVYTRRRGAERPASFVGRVASAGLLAFLAVVLVLAFAEEAAWDHLVWHEHGALFGGSVDDASPSDFALSLLVPLLALPQATHYVLDALLWRRRDTGSAQALTLGFSPAKAP